MVGPGAHRDLTIWRVAQEVRAKMETIQARSRGVYLPNLTGLCGIASRMLWRCLRAHRIPALIVVASDWLSSLHASIRVQAEHGEVVVDVTATQFDEAIPAVVMLPSASLAARAWWWVPVEVFEHENSLLHYQRNTGWDPSEIRVRP